MSDLNENRNPDSQRQDAGELEDKGGGLSAQRTARPAALPNSPKRLGFQRARTRSLARIPRPVCGLAARIVHYRHGAVPFAYDVCTFGFLRERASTALSEAFSTLNHGLLAFRVSDAVYICVRYFLQLQPELPGARSSCFSPPCSLLLAALYFSGRAARSTGILHFLCVASLIYAVCNKYCDFLFERVNLAVYLFLFVILWMLTSRKYQFEPLYLNLFGLRLEVPYFITGFTPYGFTAPDFFRNFPLDYAVFCGVVFGRYMKQGSSRTTGTSSASPA